MEDCIFCKIIKGELPSNRVFENEHAIAIMDIMPSAPGHTLVIPKEHATNIFDASEESIVEGFRVAHKIAGAVKNSVNADGLNIYINNGESAFQVVMHPHIHMLPRFKGDGHKPWGHVERSKEQIAEDAEAIRGSL